MGKYVHLSDLFTVFQIENSTRALETLPSQSVLQWKEFTYNEKKYVLYVQKYRLHIKCYTYKVCIII